MSGNLNILPHKSWNVYSAKNREKVAKDEAEYAAELKRETERLALVNADRRRTLLLSRARAAAGTATDAPVVPSPVAEAAPVDARVTLFHALTAPPPSKPVATRSVHADRPNYLHEASAAVPFYLQSGESAALPEEAQLVAQAAEASRRAQSLHTPAHVAASIVQESNARLAQLQRLQSERDRSDPMAALIRPKPKRSHADDDKSSSSSSSSSSDRRSKRRRKHKHKSKGSDLERLRAERLAREEESRRRVQALIVGERVPAAAVNATARR